MSPSKLKAEQLKSGDLQIELLLPPLEPTKGAKDHQKKQLCFNLRKSQFHQLKESFGRFDAIVAYVDGALPGKTGLAGSGACFFGQNSGG